MIKFEDVEQLINNDYIKFHAEKLDLNQKDLSQLLGVDASYMSRIFNSNIELSKSKKLAFFYIFKDLYTKKQIQNT